MQEVWKVKRGLFGERMVTKKNGAGRMEEGSGGAGGGVNKSRENVHIHTCTHSTLCADLFEIWGCW